MWPTYLTNRVKNTTKKISIKLENEPKLLVYVDGLGRTIKGAGSCLIQLIRGSNPIFRTVDKLTGGGPDF